MQNLRGMVVLLTGGFRGIGPMIAEALGKRGAMIALAARNKAGLDDVAAHLKAIGVMTLTVP